MGRVDDAIDPFVPEKPLQAGGAAEATGPLGARQCDATARAAGPRRQDPQPFAEPGGEHARQRRALARTAEDQQARRLRARRHRSPVMGRPGR